MQTFTAAEKGTYLNFLRVKMGKITKAERRYIDRAEEHVRAYAEALADVGVINDQERDDLYDQAKNAAEDRVRHFLEAEQAGRQAQQDIASLEVGAALKHQ